MKNMYHKKVSQAMKNELFMHRYQCHGKDDKLKIKQYLLWSLLRCKNGKCKTNHNRDYNSSRNMIK